MNRFCSLPNAPCWIATVALMAFQSFSATASTQRLVKEFDEKSRLEIQRPANWFLQDKPDAATRFRFGFKGTGYNGSCNINLFDSPSTAKLNQAEVDESDNRRSLTKDFFETNLRNSFEGAVVTRAVQTQIGDKWGHLVDYSYSYIDASTKKKILMQSVMFSHSQPGRFLSFTCAVGSTSVLTANAALQTKVADFNTLVATTRYVGFFDGIDLEAVSRLYEAEEKKPKKELGPIDRWRYESCRDSATKAPTTAGVNRGLGICDERFGQ